MTATTQRTTLGTANFATTLTNTARRCPDKLAVGEVVARGKHGCPRYRETTFGELEEYSNRIAVALTDIGIQRGTRTAVMVTPGRDFSAIFFALLKLEAVPVLVDPGLGLKNLKQCLAEAEPEAFIGIPRAHLARIVLGWGRKTLKHFISVGGGIAGWLPRVHRLEKLGKTVAPITSASSPVSASRPAFIAFTSGSTGLPKGVVYTHKMMHAQVEAIRSITNLKGIEADLTTFPLFSIFLPALQIASVFPEMETVRPGRSNPKYLLEAVEEFGCASMFGSPAIVELLGKYCERHDRTIPSLRVVFSAGAPARPESLARFRKALPDHAEIHTPYGATEALPVSSIESREILEETQFKTAQGAGVCVGRPVGGVKVYIIPATDESIAAWSPDLSLPRNETGEIVVKGDNVTKLYFNRPLETSLAKIYDPKTGAVYHRMGDIGHIDDQGRLWMCGRKSQRVGDLDTVNCEGIFNIHPDVFRTALVGYRQSAVLCVETIKKVSISNRNRIRKELLDLGSHYAMTRPIKTVLFFDEFPVDIRHNAKIYREKLADRVADILDRERRLSE